MRRSANGLTRKGTEREKSSAQGSARQLDLDALRQTPGFMIRILQLLNFEAFYSGTVPNAAPDTILMTSRILRLVVTRQQTGTMAPPAVAQQATSVGAAAPGPMLTFLIAPSANANASGALPWRTSLASVANSRFSGADLNAANLTSAVLQGARELSPQQLGLARTSNGTTLPNGTKGPFMRGSGAERPKR